MSTSSRNAIDRDGFSGGGFGESNDEWSSLFEKSVESATLKGGQLAENPSRQTHQFEMQDSTHSSNTTLKPLHLDLTNFEEPGAQESRYVLTSPRSLEACARFGIKPVELLHKSYEEFIDEFRSLYDTNYSHEAIFEVFQEHERQRKRKLRLCQEERDRIIRDQERRERDVIGDFTKKTRQSPTKQLSESKQAKPKSFTRTSSSPTRNKGDEAKDKPYKSYSNTSSPERKPATNGYREATASSRSKISKSQSFTSNVTRTRGESSDSDAGDSTSSHHVRRVRSQWSIPKTGSLPCSPRQTRRDSESSTSSLNRQKTSPKKQIKAMSTDCILNAVGGRRMSNKDQKIIDLMLTRHEEAQQLRKDKMMLDLAWDDQKRLENDLRQSRMTLRHTELNEQYSAKELKQMEVRARKERKELKLKQEKEEAIRAKQLLWEQEKQKQEQSLANKIELKRLAEAEKKRQQEEKRRQKQREDEMNRNIAYLSLLDKHEKALRNRSRKVTHEQFKLQIQNESEKAKIIEKREEVEKRKQEEKLDLKNQITEKHRRAIENYEDVLIRRESELRDSKRKKREKVIRQREHLNRMEAELSDWQKNLKAYQEESLKRAEAISAMNITKKQLKARTHLVTKKTVHAENYERVKEDDEKRKAELQQLIGLKDERSDTVNMEKQEALKMSREAAGSSQAARSIVKEKTYKRSFDRMARAADIRANIGRGPRKAYRNQSTLMLG